MSRDYDETDGTDWSPSPSSPESLAPWRGLCTISTAYIDFIVGLLGILLPTDMSDAARAPGKCCRLELESYGKTDIGSRRGASQGCASSKHETDKVVDHSCYACE